MEITTYIETDDEVEAVFDVEGNFIKFRVTDEKLKTIRERAHEETVDYYRSRENDFNDDR